jgi:hypothetical protein
VTGDGIVVTLVRHHLIGYIWASPDGGRRLVGVGDRTAERMRMAGRGRDEGRLERADRNFIELLQELRVTLTGVQILFAFLLTLGFMPRFERVTEFQRYDYVVTLLGSALATALLITPVAAHRLLFQSGRKAALVRTTHRCLLAGLGCLLLTMIGALLLVLDLVVGGGFAVTAAGCVGAVFLGLWFGLPLVLRAASPPGPGGVPAPEDGRSPVGVARDGAGPGGGGGQAGG